MMMMEARFGYSLFVIIIVGIWNSNAQVCDITGLTLDPMLLINGASPVGPYNLFEPVSITCTATYMSNLDSFNLCQGPDAWIVSPDTYICSAPCPGDEWNSFTVTVDSGQHFPTENVYEHNTVIGLACPEGSLEGGNTVTCEDGSWSPPRASIRCNLCGTAGLSLHPMLLIDDVIPSPSYSVFQLISVSCQPTYLSNFVDFNICLESGWITPLQNFECLAPCTSGAWTNVDVTIITGQHITTEEVYEHNTILEFSCSSGTLEGTTVSACHRGTWIPTTDSVHCNPDQQSTTTMITEAPIILSTEGTNATDTP